MTQTGDDDHGDSVHELASSTATSDRESHPYDDDGSDTKDTGDEDDDTNNHDEDESLESSVKESSPDEALGDELDTLEKSIQVLNDEKSDGSKNGECEDGSSNDESNSDESFQDELDAQNKAALEDTQHYETTNSSTGNNSSHAQEEEVPDDEDLESGRHFDENITSSKKIPFASELGQIPRAYMLCLVMSCCLALALVITLIVVALAGGNSNESVVQIATPSPTLLPSGAPSLAPSITSTSSPTASPTYAPLTEPTVFEIEASFDAYYRTGGVLAESIEVNNSHTLWVLDAFPGTSTISRVSFDMSQLPPPQAFGIAVIQNVTIEAIATENSVADWGNNLTALKLYAKPYFDDKDGRSILRTIQEYGQTGVQIVDESWLPISIELPEESSDAVLQMPLPDLFATRYFDTSDTVQRNIIGSGLSKIDILYILDASETSTENQMKGFQFHGIQTQSGESVAPLLRVDIDIPSPTLSPAPSTSSIPSSLPTLSSMPSSSQLPTAVPSFEPSEVPSQSRGPSSSPTISVAPSNRVLPVCQICDNQSQVDSKAQIVVSASIGDICGLDSLKTLCGDIDNCAQAGRLSPEQCTELQKDQIFCCQSQFECNICGPGDSRAVQATDDVLVSDPTLGTKTCLEFATLAAEQGGIDESYCPVLQQYTGPLCCDIVI